MYIRKTLILIILFFSINCDQKKPNPFINIYDDNAYSFFDNYTDLEILADSLFLPEGPVWIESSEKLLFVDNIQNKVLSWNSKEGLRDFITEAGNTGYAPNLGVGLLGPNGLATDKENNLYICQIGDRRIAKVNIDHSSDLTFTTVVDSYKGKRLNSPNDIIVADNGDIYFTDPPFGFFDPQKFEFIQSELRELSFNGVYKFTKSTNELNVIYDGYSIPNGLGLSPDENFLYVNMMGPPFSDKDSEIIKIRLSNNEYQTLFNGNDLVAKYNNGTDFDGMDVHSSGYIFTAGPGGLLVISPGGKLIARINTGQITNCTFDNNESYLYITGFLNNPKLFRIKMK